MFPACVISIFYLMHVSQSVALCCSDSLRPLSEVDPRQLEGTWALVAGSFIDPEHLEFFKRRNSSSITFSHLRFHNGTPNFVYSPSVHFEGRCHFGSYNVSLKGSVLAFEEGNHTLTFLSTSCRDCVAMELKTPQWVYLFSRRRGLSPAELEEFAAQAKCLGMLPPAAMDPAEPLCQREEQHGWPLQPKTEKSALLHLITTRSFESRTKHRGMPGKIDLPVFTVEPFKP